MPPSMNPRVPHRPLRHRKGSAQKKKRGFLGLFGRRKQQPAPPTGSRAGSGACAGSRASPSAGTQPQPTVQQPEGDQRVKLNVKPISWPAPPPPSRNFVHPPRSTMPFTAITREQIQQAQAVQRQTSRAVREASPQTVAAPAQQPTANRRCSSSCSAARCTKGFSHTDGFSHAVLAGVTQPHGELAGNTAVIAANRF